ncbi:MAG: hypothetical protein MUE60_03480 [Candidatus Eisenbacteria bacterium]|jgi:hypothetical protein|nr:hypothetical protein [Candidatus Eisenbacteria bacterium]
MIRGSFRLLLSALLLGGCTHPVAHRYAIDPSWPEDLQKLHDGAKGRDLRVEFTGGCQVSARELAVRPDSTSFLIPGIWRPGRESFGSGHFRIAPTDSVREIRVFMRQETTLVTTLGLAAGGALASLLAFHALCNALSEEGDVGYDIRFAIPGLLTGALYGFFIGEANAEWDAYDLTCGGGTIQP